MVMYDKEILLPVDWVNRVKKLNTTLLSDAMGCIGSMDYRIKPVASGMKIIGTAATLSLRPGDNLFLHQAIYTGKDGFVLVVDGKGHTENAYLGELMAAAAKAVGLNGIIIDGLVRDKQALTELGFPVFAKGFIPNGPFKDGPGEMNVPISCGGVSVHPGDLIVGDDDGVIVVPRHKIEDAIVKAEEKQGYEKKRIETIEAYKESRKQGRHDVTLEPSWLKGKMSIF
jgi:4-hydroxy-4-methyl-2-oxoglutarate aldolase